MDEIKDLRGDYPKFRIDLNDRCPYKKCRGRSETDRGHMQTVVEIGVMQPHAKEFLEPSEAAIVKEAFSLRTLRGIEALLTPS